MESSTYSEVAILAGAGIAIMLTMAVVLIAFYGQAQRRLLAQRLEAQELTLQKTIMAQEQERTRIARDLHDDIGSKLSMASMQLQMLGDGSVPSEKLGASVGEIDQILKTTLATTRRMSHELLPPALKSFGLTTALEDLFRGYERAKSIDYELKLNGLSEAVTEKATELNLFRVMQELSKNSLVHGEAPHISLRFVPDASRPRLQYRDTGKGFEKDKLVSGKGLGMENIESRLKMIGASWEFDAAPGEGMRAEIVLNTSPVKPQKADGISVGLSQ